MIEDLAKHRATKTGDCRNWSVADALREALRQVESGEIKPAMVFIAFAIDVNENRRDHIYQCAGGNKLELVGLLCRHLHLVNDA